MTTSDIVLIGSTLFLGIVALLTPTFADVVKHWWARPELSCDFHLSSPACHKTDLAYPVNPSQIVKDPDYIYRLEVENSGRSQARRCEVVLEGLDAIDAAGNYQPYLWSTPVSLPWGSGYSDFVDINPKRKFYCDLLSVPGERYQKLKADLDGWVNPPRTAPFPLGVILNVKSSFFSQPNRLPPGKYRLHLAVYSENAAKVEKSLNLAWSGKWKDEEKDFFRECVVSS